MSSKYPRIQASLKTRLLSGAYDHQPIPSEAQLALEFGVSRMTARRAVDELEREGLIYRVQGSGSYPTGQRFQQGVFRIRSLEEMAGRDHVPFTRVLKSELVLANAEVGAALAVATGTAVLEVVRLRGFEPNRPLLLERRWLRSETEAILQQNMATESLHALLVTEFQLEIGRVEQQLEAVTLEAAEAHLLNEPVGAAAFLMTRLVHSRLPHTSEEVAISLARYWVRAKAGAFVSAFV